MGVGRGARGDAGRDGTRRGVVRTNRRRLAVAVAAVLVVAGAGASAAAATWPRTTSPTYTGPGSSPITESFCKDGGCGFATSDGGRFMFSLPAGFVPKYQGTASMQTDDMAVVKAMLTLKNTLNESAIPSATTVSPAYAAKLATVGVTPAQFLAWLYVNVPAAQRPPWVPGSANAPQAAVEPPPRAATPVGQAGAPPQRAASVIPRKPGKARSPASAYPAPATAPAPMPATLRRPANGQRSSASGTHALRQAPSAPPPPALREAAGTVAPNPAACPRGYSEVNAPNGGRCLPDPALGVRPLPSRPWGAGPRSMDVAGAVALALLVATAVAALRRRRRHAVRRETPATGESVRG